MKKILTASVLAIGAWAGVAQAAPTITFTGGGSGSAAGTTAFQTFDGVTVPGGTQGPAIGTNAYIYSTTTYAQSTKPAGASGNFAAVLANGSYSVSFGPSSIFSFVVGSLDTYNELKLYYSDGTLASDLQGAAIIGGGSVVFGSATDPSANGLVTFTADAGKKLGSATFLSNGVNSFEFDTLSAVPEPAAWGMMILGFGLVGGVLRRRPSVKVKFA